MVARRVSTTKPVDRHRGSPGRPTADIDRVMLRTTTIERRLEGIEATLTILTDRVSDFQVQLNHLASKRQR